MKSKVVENTVLFLFLLLSIKVRIKPKCKQKEVSCPKGIGFFRHSIWSVLRLNGPPIRDQIEATAIKEDWHPTFCLFSIVLYIGTGCK